MHNNNNYQCKMCWNKALTFGVGSIQLSFRTIVFTQYMQRCFQSKCYSNCAEGLHFSALHLYLVSVLLSPFLAQTVAEGRKIIRDYQSAKTAAVKMKDKYYR